jgi:hypothetical protein
MKIGSIYSASDKSLFDALTQSAVTNQQLRNLFFQYGIVISKNTSRRQLAKFFSRLLLDYDAFQTLAGLFDTGQRKERVSCIRIKSSATIDLYEAAAHRLVQTIAEDGNSAKVIRKEGEPLRIEVTYKKFRFDRNEFRQIVTKKAEIFFEEKDGQVLVTGPQNENVDEWLKNLIADVQEHVEEPLEIDEVSLEQQTSPAVRTKFFTSLIKSIEGFSFVDVSDVYLHQPKSGTDEGIETEPSIDSDGIAEADDSGSETTTPDVHISRAALRGQGVLSSKQATDLLAQGFYIARIIWTAKTSYFDSDLYEFEAQFAEPDTCNLFSYVAKGFYAYKGDGEYATSRSQFTKAEDVRLGRLIEEAAHRVLNTLINTEK